MLLSVLVVENYAGAAASEGERDIVLVCIKRDAVVRTSSGKLRWSGCLRGRDIVLVCIKRDGVERTSSGKLRWSAYLRGRDIVLLYVPLLSCNQQLCTCCVNPALIFTQPCH